MIYLDNAATTKPSETAFRKAEEFALRQFYNPSALYQAGHVLQSELKKARSALLCKVADENSFEWVFTSCGTEADNQAVFSFAKRGNAVTTAVMPAQSPKNQLAERLGQMGRVPVIFPV